MKCLSLTQPYASLVAISAKRIETRGWRTSYRGPLAIHAAKGFPKDARANLDTFVFYGAFRPEHAAMLQREGVRLVPMACAREVANSLPLGAVIATCNLVACVRTEDIPPALRGTIYYGGTLLSAVTAEITDQEHAFGDFSPGRFAWFLADIKLLPEPIPAKGSLSLWEWNP
jgi:hypothetical protein